MEDTVLHEHLSLSKHLVCSDEPLLQQAFQCSQWSSPPESPSKLKARGNKNTMMLGSQNCCMVNLLRRFMVALTCGSGWLIVI